MRSPPITSNSHREYMPLPCPWSACLSGTRVSAAVNRVRELLVVVKVNQVGRLP